MWGQLQEAKITLTWLATPRVLCCDPALICSLIAHWNTAGDGFHRCLRDGHLVHPDIKAFSDTRVLFYLRVLSRAGNGRPRYG